MHQQVMTRRLIDPDTDHIFRNYLSSWARVDEDLVISGIARHIVSFYYIQLRQWSMVNGQWRSWRRMRWRLSPKIISTSTTYKSRVVGDFSHALNIKGKDSPTDRRYSLPASVLDTHKSMPWQAAPPVLIIMVAFNVAAGLIYTVDRTYHGKVRCCQITYHIGFTFLFSFP